MGRAKKKKKPASAASRRSKLVSFLRGPGRPMVLVGLLAVALLGGWCAVWYGSGVRDYVFSSGQYLVGPGQVEITEPPDWIHTDIRAEVFRNASLDGRLSIMDDDLTERIDNAFSLHPWIAKVRQVTKHHPARVEVELVYRRPVCMVEVRGSWLPVDAKGVLLPRGDFSQVEASRYPLLLGIETLPVATVGEGWGDARVVGGAEIATALGPMWHQLRLAQIVPSVPLAPGIAEGHTYKLITRGGTRIFWGKAPSTKAPGELPTADKLARLQQYVAEHGTLEGRHGPQELDVYRLQAPRVSSLPKR